jgi:putative flippase GtrA
VGQSAIPLRQRLHAEIAAFGVVGAICLISDIVLFNFFAFGVGMSPVLAKSVGVVITGVMAFFGHRYVTFRHRSGGGVGREVPVFAGVTVVTVVLSLLPLVVARHTLGITSVFWLNAANLLGIALGTVARYLAYRGMVWKEVPATDPIIVSGSDTSSPGRPLGNDRSPREQVGSRRLLEVQHELIRE